jgi:hypothetical protein
MVDDDIVTKELSINIIIRDRAATTRDNDVTYDDDAVHEELRLEFDSKVVPKVTKLKSTISESMLNQLYTIVVQSIMPRIIHLADEAADTDDKNHKNHKKNKRAKEQVFTKLPCGARGPAPGWAAAPKQTPRAVLHRAAG